MLIPMVQLEPACNKPWSARKAAIVATNFREFADLARRWGDDRAAEMLTQAIDGPQIDVSHLKPDADGVLASGEWGTIRLRSIPLRNPS